MAFLHTASETHSALSLPVASGDAAARAGLRNASRLQSDEDLLVLAGEGNADAFRLLAERHADRAYAVALRITGNAADAEDVVQDTLLKIWTLGRRWEGGRAKFSTWLYRVIVNRCIDIKRRPKTDESDDAADIASHAPDQVDMLLRTEASNALALAIAGLPEQQRLALILSYYENMSNTQIAEITETSVMAVESLLKRARAHLRDSLRNERIELLYSLQNT